MNDDESLPRVAPPLYVKTDPHQDTLPPYRKNEDEPLTTPPQLLGDGRDGGGVADAPTGQAATKRTRKKRYWVVGSLVLLAIIIAATAGGGYYAKRSMDPDFFYKDPRKTGIQPDSRGPSVVALADDSNRRMTAYSNGISNGEVWIWHVSAEGKLANKGRADGDRTEWGATEWETAGSPRFLTAPVLASDGHHGTSGFAVALEASTGAVLSCYFSRDYERMRDCRWQSLGGRFINPPAALWANTHTAQVFAVAENGQLWRRRVDEWPGGEGRPTRPTWFDWELVGDGFAGELSTYDMGWYTYVAAARQGTYHVLESRPYTETWPEVWEDYGRPPLCTESFGAPKLISMSFKQLGILVACNGKLWHKAVNITLTRDLDWRLDTEWHLFDVPGGENLTHSINTQILLGEKVWWAEGIQRVTQYLMSRTSDHCYYSTEISRGNETTGDGGIRAGPWKQLWCQTEGGESLATAVACYSGSCNLYREGADGRILRSVSQPWTSVEGDWVASTMEPTWESLEGP